MSTLDLFAPKHEPARTLYLAFMEEAGKRSRRQFRDWIRAESKAVHAAATAYARAHGLRAPSLDEVRRAEIGACGHADYGKQWALGVAQAMQRPAPAGKPTERRQQVPA